MRKFVYIVFSLLLCNSVFAQHGEVDSAKYHKVDEQLQKAQEFFTTGNVDSILHYYHAAQNLAQEYDLKEKISDTYYEEAKLYLMMNDRDNAMSMFKKAADNARQNSYWMGLNKALGQMASLAWMAGENVEGLQYAKEAVEAGQNAKYDRGVAIGYLQSGNILQNLARNEEALQSYLEASKYFDKCGFKSGVASCWINMAGIYYTLENFDLALEYDRKAMDLQRSLGNMGEVANVMQNMAAIYAGFNRQNAVTKYSHLDSAFYYYNEAIKVYEEQKDSLNITKCWTNLGLMYMVSKDWNMSKKYFGKAAEVATRRNYTNEIISIYNGYALLYQGMKQYEKSKEYFLKEYPYIKAGEFKEKEMMWYRDMARTLDSLGEYEEALRNYEKFVVIQDTLRRNDIDRQMNQLSARYGSELKDQEIAAAKERQALMKREQDALRKRFLVMVGAAIIIGIFLIFVVYLFIQKRKANVKLAEQNEQINKQNIEIERQRDEVTAQKEQIELQQQNILDSIHYASRIQSAILPRPELVEDLFHEHRFILFKPRDIVSGDYYWIGKKAQWKIAVAADCTGHGVPGAFMSMLGTAFLNEIINDPTMPDIHAGEILDKLRGNIIKALKQTGAAGEQKDGMDLAMWMFDEETRQVRYAGANNPLVIVRKDFVEGEVEEDDRIKIQEFVSETNGETYHIIQIAGNKQPIAIYPEMVPFEEVCLTLKPGDTLYTFSDGFQDQFGGEKGKKFMIKRLKQVFVNMYESTMAEQRELLDHELVTWIEKGNTEQVDDVLVIGYRV